MNSCTFFGRLVGDAELRYTPDKMAVANFSLAVNRSFQKGDVKADFLNMTAFGKTAETINGYFHKGSRIVVHCHAQQNNYTNKAGQKVNTVGFIVDSFSFVDTRSEGGVTQNQNTNHTEPQPQTSSSPDPYGWMNIPDGVEDDTLPFN